MKFHVAMSINGILREPSESVAGMFQDRETGKSLEYHEVYLMAINLKSQGFEVIPPCDNHDAKGYCNGHETET